MSHPRARSPRTRGLRGAVAAGTATLAAAVWALWPSAGASAPTSTARAYSAYTACLLTDAAGIGSRSAQPVWAGMEAASSATSMQVSYLAVAGPQDAADVRSYLNTLLGRRCDVIVAVGTQETAAVAAAAGAHASARFVVVGAPSSGANVAAVEGTAVTERLKQDLVAAESGDFHDGAAGVAE